MFLEMNSSSILILVMKKGVVDTLALLKICQECIFESESGESFVGHNHLSSQFFLSNRSDSR